MTRVTKSGLAMGKGGVAMTMDATNKMGTASTGAVGKLGKSGIAMTMDATRAAVSKGLEVGKGSVALTMDVAHKGLEVGKGSLALTMDVARKTQNMAMAAGSAVAGATVASVGLTKGLGGQGDKPPDARKDATWQSLIDDSDAAPIALTAAEREKLREIAIAEDEWEACPKWLWFPVSSTRQTWDLVMLVLVIYMSVLTPYRLAFESATSHWMMIELCVQAVFCLDVLANFNTPFLVNGQWRISRPAIAIKYFSSWFWVDFPSSLPIELIEHELHLGHGPTELLPMARILRLLRLIRLLRLLRIEHWLRLLETRLGVDLSGLRVLKTVVLMLFFCHLLACIFYAVGYAPLSHGEGDGSSHEPAGDGQQPDKTWVSAFDDGVLVSDPRPPPFHAYVIAFFWALGIVCGQNTNVTPESMADRYVAIACYLLGTFFLAYVIAVVTDQLREVVADPFNMAMDDVLKFMRFHRIDREGGESLGERIKAFYSSYYASRSMVDDKEIVGRLTPALRAEAMEHLLASTVHAFPLLQPQSRQSGIELYASFRSRTLLDERRRERHIRFQVAP